MLIRNYGLSNEKLLWYYSKLPITPAAITKKKEIDVGLDWSHTDVREYLNHENQTANSSIRVLKNKKIKTVSLHIFKVCSNDQCVNKVEFGKRAKGGFT